jgi:hypothetical protein
MAFKFTLDILETEETSCQMVDNTSTEFKEGHSERGEKKSGNILRLFNTKNLIKVKCLLVLYVNYDLRITTSW